MKAINYELRELARNRLKLALRKGKIIKPDNCQECGKKAKLCAHHHDYNLPLDVQWLCYSCHAKQHPERWQRMAEINRQAPALKKALEWFKVNPDKLETKSRELVDEIGVSHMTINRAQRILRAYIKGLSNG